MILSIGLHPITFATRSTGIFCGIEPGVATVSIDEQRRSGDVVDRWFRQLDQRRIYQGAAEWAVQVTGILCEEGVVWIQIADDARLAGSVLLRVRPTTSVEQAINALTSRARDAAQYPRVINAFKTPRAASII